MSGKLSAELVDRARSADILATAQSLGARLRRVTAAELAGPCLICNGTDRFSINVKRGLWHCRGCIAGGADAISLVRHARGLDFRAAVEWLTGEQLEPKRQHLLEAAVAGPPKPAGDEEARNLRNAARLVAEMVPIKGSPGERYLADVRRIDTTAIIDALERVDAIGWHPSVYFHEPEHPGRGDPPHPLHGRKLGCIVAIMTDPVSAAPTGAISRTYLAPDGRKVVKAKTLGAPAGIIRLSRDEEVEGGLHIAEGLETALAVMSKGFRPTWATSSTALMSKFPVLAGIEALTIFADHDENGAGEKAAREAEARWRDAGRKVRLLRFNRFGDFNDALAGDAA
jgi:hypothetical protein